MILLTVIIAVFALFFLCLTILSIVNLSYQFVYPHAVLLVLCVASLVLIKSASVEKDLLNSNCGTNFSTEQVLFANSAVKSIYESKGYCYPTYEEEQSTEPNPQ